MLRNSYFKNKKTSGGGCLRFLGWTIVILGMLFLIAGLSTEVGLIPLTPAGFIFYVVMAIGIVILMSSNRRAHIPFYLKKELKKLESKDNSTRKIAVEKLGDDCDRLILRPYIKEFEYFPEFKDGLNAINKIRRDVVYRALKKIVTDDNLEQRKAAEQSINNIKNKIISFLLEKFPMVKNSEDRIALENSLELVDPNWARYQSVKNSMDTFISVLADTTILDEIEKSYDDNQKNLLKNMYKERKHAAVNTLVKIGPDVIKPLSSKVENLNKNSLEYVFRVFIKIGEPALETLLELSGSNNQSLRELSAKSLFKISVSVESLIHFLKNDKNYIRKSTVELLGESNNTQAVEPLASMLNDQDKDMIIAAVAALVKFSSETLVKTCSPGVIESLFSLLEDNRIDFRRSVIELIGKFKNKRAVEPLISIAEDEREEIKIACATALGRIGGKKASKHLISLFQEESDSVKLAAAKALAVQKGELEEDSTIYLITLLEKDDQSIKSAAAKALKSINWQPTNDEQLLHFAIATNDINKLTRFSDKVLVSNCRNLKWIKDSTICDDCNNTIYAPSGYINIKNEHIMGLETKRYLICEKCLHKKRNVWNSYTGEGTISSSLSDTIDVTLAKKRALYFWKTGNIVKASKIK